MPWFLKPSTWRRLPSDDDGRLEYGSRMSLVVGTLLCILAVSGLVGTTSELIHRWPEQRGLLIGGLVFSCLILAIGLFQMLRQRVLIDKPKGHIVCTWRWLLWGGERSYNLAAYNSVGFAPGASPRLFSDDMNRVFTVALAANDETQLTMFEQQCLEDARRLTAEIADFTGLPIGNASDNNADTSQRAV